MISGPPYHACCNINNHLIREAPKTDVVDFVLNSPNKVWQRHFCASKKTVYVRTTTFFISISVLNYVIIHTFANSVFGFNDNEENRVSSLRSIIMLHSSYVVLVMMVHSLTK